MDELRIGLRRLQFEKGRPDSRPGAYEAPEGASSPSLEADLRRSNESCEKLVQVHQRGLLDSRARRLITERQGASRRFQTPVASAKPLTIQECSPGSGLGLQNRWTVFESLRSCFAPRPVEKAVLK